MSRTCSLKDCSNKHYQAGLCCSHYERKRKHGDPMAGGASKGAAINWIMESIAYEGDDCIAWPFYRAKSGYGRITYNSKRLVASRLMCELAHGLPPSSDMDAAHSCGNGHKGCMNPRHLSWKSKVENSADRIIHGTHRQGADINFTKLKEHEVLEIFRRAKAGDPQKEIASDFGIVQAQVSRILLKQRWRHLTRDL